MKNIDEANFEGKKVLMRVDFNVPLNGEKEVTDDTRIKAAIPTIQKIIEDGGAIILMAHLGKPKGEYKEELSLKHVLPSLEKHLNLKVQFAGDCIGKEAEEKADKLKSGEVLLLENLRFHKEEKEGNEDFGKKLAALGDVYVNDAFGAAHRAHASVVTVPKFMNERFAGKLFLKELEEINKVVKDPEKPFTAIIGGAKVSDKVKVIEVLLDKVDTLIIGGAMAYVFIKATGGDVGDSKVETDAINEARRLHQKAFDKKVKIILPEDSVIIDTNETIDPKEEKSKDIPKNYKGMDIGTGARKLFKKIINDSRTILWNGPMGVFENPKFAGGTEAVARAIAEATKNGAYSLAGGGETSAAINKFKLADQFSHVSTGGGAMLKYIEGKELPAVKALEEAPQFVRQ